MQTKIYLNNGIGLIYNLKHFKTQRNSIKTLHCYLGLKKIMCVSGFILSKN